MDPNHPQRPQTPIQFPLNFLDLSENPTSYQDYQFIQPNMNLPPPSNFQAYQNPSSHFQAYQNPHSLTFTSHSSNTQGSTGSTSEMHRWGTSEEIPCLDNIQPNLEEGDATRRQISTRGRARGRGGRAIRGRGVRTSTGERVKWSQGEELLLVSAWINVSTDPIVTTNSTLTAFWERVAEYYNMHRGDAVERISSTCKSRWHKISPDVSKFVGAYEQASNLQSSGQGQADVLKKAHEIFNEDMRYDFVFEHCWRELRNEPKWRSLYKESSESAGGSSKRSKTNEDGSYSTSDGSGTPTSAPVRPIGQKAAKAALSKGKKVVGSSSHPLEEIGEVYNKLMEKRDARIKAKSDDIGKQVKIASDYLRANNMNALSILMAKPELTPNEEMIKKFLVAELFPNNG